MTITIDPAIQQQYDQNLATRKAEAAEVSGELKARQDKLAEQIKKDQESLAALGKRLTESTVEPPPAPVRRPEDNDISAQASAYQEGDDEPEPPAPVAPAPAPVVRAVRPPVEDEEVPSFQWDEDPPSGATAPPAAAPDRATKRERPPAAQDADEDLSEHDWLE